MVLTRAYPNFRLDIRASVPLLDCAAKFGMLISVWVLVHAGAPEREAPLFFSDVCQKHPFDGGDAGVPMHASASVH